MTKAKFISRTGAYLALQREGRRKGLSDEKINTTGRVYPVYQRGCLSGFEAWLDRSPLMEA